MKETGKSVRLAGPNITCLISSLMSWTDHAGVSGLHISLCLLQDADESMLMGVRHHGSHAMAIRACYDNEKHMDRLRVEFPSPDLCSHAWSWHHWTPHTD